MNVDGVIRWLAFTPAYSSARGSQVKRLGAHAFRDDAPRSLCGYVERERAGGPADEKARRCEWCTRVEIGRSQDQSEWQSSPPLRRTYEGGWKL